MIVVAMISLLPGALIGVAVFFLVRRFASSATALTAACIVGFVCALALVTPTLNWIVAKTTTTQLNAASSRAAEIMRTPALPADRISDFCFQISLRSASPIADFQMSQQDFVDWMTAEGWQPQEFNDPAGRVELRGANRGSENSGSMIVSTSTSVYPLRSGNGQQEHLVTRGHLVNQRVGDSTRTFIYDADTERVYFSHSIY